MKEDEYCYYIVQMVKYDILTDKWFVDKSKRQVINATIEEIEEHRVATKSEKHILKNVS